MSVVKSLLNSGEGLPNLLEVELGFKVKVSGIYCIKNISSESIYIGQSKDIESRFKKHKYDLNKGIHHSKSLQTDWISFGEDIYSFEVVEVVPDFALLDERESHWISKIKPRYNSKKGNAIQTEADRNKLKIVLAFSNRKEVFEHRQKQTADMLLILAKFEEVVSKTLYVEQTEKRGYKLIKSTGMLAEIENFIKIVIQEIHNESVMEQIKVQLETDLGGEEEEWRFDNRLYVAEDCLDSEFLDALEDIVCLDARVAVYRDNKDCLKTLTQKLQQQLTEVKRLSEFHENAQNRSAKSFRGFQVRTNSNSNTKNSKKTTRLY